MLTSLLVGSYHRPPAGKVLLHMPSGAALALRAEPDNPYDEWALQVWCKPAEVIPPGQHELLEQALDGTGYELAEVLAMPELQLGYVAASGGKPLAKAGVPGLVGNQELAGAQRALLAFSPEGKPLLRVEVPDAN